MFGFKHLQKKNFKKESKKKQSHGKLQFTTLADFPTPPLDSREKYSTLTGKSKLTILVQMKATEHHEQHTVTVALIH